MRNRFYWQVLLGCLLCIFLTGVFYLITFKRPSVLGLEVFSRSNGTRTAIALTSQALYGPFPTATGPTPTITKTPTVTPTVTITPSNTATSTPIRFFLDTITPRTALPNTGITLIPSSTLAPTAIFINTSIPPTNPPFQPTQPAIQPTQPPFQPTQPVVQPTQPPVQPTQPPPQPTQPPPQPTQPPATKKACVNPQGHPIPCH